MIESSDNCISKNLLIYYEDDLGFEHVSVVVAVGVLSVWFRFLQQSHADLRTMRNKNLPFLLEFMQFRYFFCCLFIPYNCGSFTSDYIREREIILYPASTEAYLRNTKGQTARLTGLELLNICPKVHILCAQ